MTRTITRPSPADIAARRQAYQANRSAPDGAQRVLPAPAETRSSLIERDGKEFVLFEGTASVVERWYDMWDPWGPYVEKIARGAFDKTLAQMPDVNFLLNHRGMTMARTKVSKTLELFVGAAGDLDVKAYCNPQRQDVADLRIAIDDGDVSEMSFAFMITDGSWNMDFTEFTITEVDLDRGDVSAVNYGANPFTSISARAQDTFDGISRLSLPALAEARAQIDERMTALGGEQREEQTPPAAPAPALTPQGESVEMAHLRMQLAE